MPLDTYSDEISLENYIAIYIAFIGILNFYTGNIHYVHTCTVNGSLTCSFWLQVLDGQTSARPFPVLSDDIIYIIFNSSFITSRICRKWPASSHAWCSEKLTMHMLVSSTSFVHAVYTLEFIYKYSTYCVAVHVKLLWILSRGQEAVNLQSIKGRT